MPQKKCRSVRYGKHAGDALSACFRQNEFDQFSAQTPAANLLVNGKRTNLGKVRSVILQRGATNQSARFRENEELRYLLTNILFCARQ